LAAVNRILWRHFQTDDVVETRIHDFSPKVESVFGWWALPSMPILLSYDMKTITQNDSALTSAQIRAGRSLIRWTADDLARASAVGVATIRRAELSDNQTSLTAANDLAIRRALEFAGVEFIDENGSGPGVRLRERQARPGK
jgi:hypothetical protein